jgi:4-diphosphocytidyl-2-C-methyl-D-erythritol kinase
LEKNIPAGGGLGGGSSNAAATLMACNTLFHTALSEKDLDELALRVGSDVPFFLRGGTAIGEGRGEVLTPLQLDNSFSIVLLLPGIHVSTGWAYKAAKIDLTKNKKISTFRALFRGKPLKALQKQLVNELEFPVFERHPELKLLKQKLYDLGADYASMSGSGSTLFGLFTDAKLAEKVAAQIQRHEQIKTQVCSPVQKRV